MFQLAILVAQKFNITLNDKQITCRVESTSGRDIIEVLDRTCLAIAENQVLGIVGPEYSTEAKILARFGNRAGLPIIGYSTTEPELTDRNAYKTFYRLPPSNSIMAQAVLKLFQKYGWNSTNVIFQGDSYGQSGFQALTDVFRNDVKIARSIRFDLFTQTIENLQRHLEESPSRIVIVIATASVTTKIIELSREIDGIMAPSFLWILTTSNSSLDIINNNYADQLKGMLLLRLVPPDKFDPSTNITLLNAALSIWQERDPDSYHHNSENMDIFALYAFDAAWLLILALQKLCQQNSNCSSFENTSNCFNCNFTASDELHEILQTISFVGLSGRVQFGLNTTDQVNGTRIQYAIDNLQSSGQHDPLKVIEILRLNASLLNMTRNSTTEWVDNGNSIQWPRKYNEAPKDYALLEGKKFNITVYISPPFFMVKPMPNNPGQYIYEGYVHELLLTLKKWSGMDYNYVIASNDTSYDELVDCVKNNTCEIVVADLANTPSRLSLIDFSHSIYDNALRLVVRKSQAKKFSTFAFLKPFTISLWLAIICIIYIPSVILIGIYEFYQGDRDFREFHQKDRNISESLQIDKSIDDSLQEDKRIDESCQANTNIDQTHPIEKTNDESQQTDTGIKEYHRENRVVGVSYQVHRDINESNETDRDIKSKSLIMTFGKSLYYTIGALIQNGSELHAKTMFGRIQTVIVWLVSLIIIALFTSNLIIYFTEQNEQSWLTAIDDLVMCRKVECDRIGVVERSQHEEYFTKEVMHDFQMNYYPLKHQKECYAKLLDGHIDVALADSASAEYFTQTEYCELELVGAPFAKTYFGVAMPKQWPYKQDLDTHILKLRTNGEMDRILANYYQQKNCDGISDNRPKHEDEGLSLFETSGLFIIYGTFTGLNLMFYITYRVIIQLRRRNYRSSDTSILTKDAST